MRDTRTEREIERAGDAIMAAVGFTVIRFSQARATMQTPGISDRLYIGRDRAVWWEAKRAGMRLGDGSTRRAFYKQTEPQKAFQRLVESVGWQYVCGPDDALVDWLEAQGLAKRKGLSIQILPRTS